MKPFDLEAAKAGAPIVTRDGQKVKFIAHVPELDPNEAVIVLIDGYAGTTGYYKSGRYLLSCENDLDLMMFEKKVVPVVRWLWADKYGTMSSDLYSEAEQQAHMPDYPIKLEWSRTEFPV